MQIMKFQILNNKNATISNHMNVKINIANMYTFLLL